MEASDSSRRLMFSNVDFQLPCTCFMSDNRTCKHYKIKYLTDGCVSETHKNIHMYAHPRAVILCGNS